MSTVDDPRIAILYKIWADNIMRSILHIRIECEEYFAKNCQSHRTLLWA